MRNYQTAFWDSALSDNEPFEKWSEEGGSTDIATRANRLWKKTLAEYEAPPLDLAVDEALCDYVAQEGGHGRRLVLNSLPPRTFRQ